MTTIQKIIFTITILTFSILTLFVIGIYLSQSNTCQAYDYSKVPPPTSNSSYEIDIPCLRFGNPPMEGFLIVWLVGTGIMFLIATPIYLIWGKNKNQDGRS